MPTPSWPMRRNRSRRPMRPRAKRSATSLAFSCMLNLPGVGAQGSGRRVAAQGVRNRLVGDQAVDAAGTEHLRDGGGLGRTARDRDHVLAAQPLEVDGDRALV